jgi:hypothetical protein
MSPLRKPQAGQSWRPPERRTSTLPATVRPARCLGDDASCDAQLAADVAALVNLGLITPVQDGQTVRFAINPESEGELL